MSEELSPKISYLRELADLLEDSKKVWYSTSPSNKIVIRLRKVNLSVLSSWDSAYPGKTWKPLKFEEKDLKKCFKPRDDPVHEIDWEAHSKRALELYRLIEDKV